MHTDNSAVAAGGTGVPETDEARFGADAFASTLEAAAAGSEWARRILVKRYSGALLGYLRQRAPGDPEAVLSETWMSAASTIGSFSGEEPAFRSWLFVIAHRRAIDAARKASRRPDVVDRADAYEASSSELSAEDQAFVGMSVGHAIELLSTLTPDQQSAIALRVIADLSLKETARIMGKQGGAVKALQKRGLETLRRQLEQAASSPGEPGLT